MPISDGCYGSCGLTTALQESYQYLRQQLPLGVDSLLKQQQLESAALY